MSIQYDPTDGSWQTAILNVFDQQDIAMGRAIDKIDTSRHQYWTKWTTSMGIDPESPIIHTWRMREPFSPAQSWTEIGLFVGLAVAIQWAYSVIWPPNDEVTASDNQPGGFPLDKINPLRRHDLTLLKTQSLNELYLARQREEEMRILSLQELYRQQGLDAGDIQQLLGDAAAIQEAESLEG